MRFNKDIKQLLWLVLIFAAVYFMPIGRERFDRAILDAFALLKWYAREHVILCLIPAFFIAGLIGVFVSQAAVIKYFGAGAKAWVSYLIASVSGSVLAVCSCTILPLFAGIYKRGAGIGPAVTFLYAGPAVNILAIILTARILGMELGLARITGAVVFAIIIGLIMQFLYRHEEQEKREQQLFQPAEETRPLWQTVFHFSILVAILVAATLGKPDSASGFWFAVWSHKWWAVSGLAIFFAWSLVFIMRLRVYTVIIAATVTTAVAVMVPNQPLVPFVVGLTCTTLLLWFHKGEPREWLQSTWEFAVLILPLLAAGVLVSGFLLGLPGGEGGLLPDRWIMRLVGGNSLSSNFFASIVGALMYFATLTEIPILQGLIAGGMGKGPALALLLAGPAVSLPNMLVIRGIIGTVKTMIFMTLVIVMATFSGLLFGYLMG